MLLAAFSRLTVKIVHFASLRLLFG